MGTTSPIDELRSTESLRLRSHGCEFSASMPSLCHQHRAPPLGRGRRLYPNHRCQAADLSFMRGNSGRTVLSRDGPGCRHGWLEVHMARTVGTAGSSRRRSPPRPMQLQWPAAQESGSRDRPLGPTTRCDGCAGHRCERRGGPFMSTTRTGGELAIVCPRSNL